MGVYDADGDAVTMLYRWFVNGAFSGITTATLGGTDFGRDNLVAVEVTPTGAFGA